MQHGRIPECLGAHVSVKGGVHRAPVRGRAIGATAIQVFTKTPGQWREPDISRQSFHTFRTERERLELTSIVAHDSYLINLASPDPLLSARSEASFIQELRRCEAYDIGFWCRTRATISTTGTRVSPGTPRPIPVRCGPSPAG